jgi:hypothetical protein
MAFLRTGSGYSFTDFGQGRNSSRLLWRWGNEGPFPSFNKGIQGFGHLLTLLMKTFFPDGGLLHERNRPVRIPTQAG